MAKRKQGKILEYSAVFDPAEEGGFNVSFPDFPGCFTFGKNFEEAKEMAKEALELWIEVLQEEHHEIPVKTHRPIIDEITVSLPVR